MSLLTGNVQRCCTILCERNINTWRWVYSNHIVSFKVSTHFTRSIYIHTAFHGTNSIPSVNTTVMSLCSLLIDFTRFKRQTTLSHQQSHIRWWAVLTESIPLLFHICCIIKCYIIFCRDSVWNFYSNYRRLASEYTARCVYIRVRYIKYVLVVCRQLCFF